MKIKFILIFILILLTGCSSAKPKQVSWDDQIIYFVMTDRFNNGNSTNDNMGVGEYNPKENGFYSGGDIEGITDKIEYIKNLGATAVWITPPVANQWIDPWNNYTGYHGYWAENFKEVDKHYGNLKDYKRLSDKIHTNDMLLIQDIVCNHTGNFFRYVKQEDGKEKFEYNRSSKPDFKPSQYPFNLNNGESEKDSAEGIYNFNPDIRNYSDEKERLTHQLSGLDDLNTVNPKVRDTLKDSYKYWIEKAGVDGYRIDTAIYVEHDFLNDFIYGKGGVKESGKKAGKEIEVFGEAWFSGENSEDNIDIKTADYLGKGENKELDRVLNFPMSSTIREVFCSSAPTKWLEKRVENVNKIYGGFNKTLNFIDNHDMERFCAIGNRVQLEQSLVFIMTLPGIPVIYYGTEQEFKSVRGSMFKEGFGSNGTDNFNQESVMYKFIKEFAELRKSDKIFSRGEVKVLKSNSKGSGVFIYELSYEGRRAVVVMNSSDEAVYSGKVKMEGANNGTLKFKKGISEEENIRVENGGFEKLLKPRETGVYYLEEEKNREEVLVENIEGEITQTGDKLQLKGEVKEKKNLFFSADGKIIGRVKEEKGILTADLSNCANGNHKIEFFVKNGVKTKYVASKEIEIKRDRELESVYVDKIGDDFGRDCKYSYPLEKSFKGCMDIKGVKIYREGKDKIVEIETANPIVKNWNPKNGFDHVSFNIYISTDEERGSSVMPLQNGKLKDGMSWNYMAFITGWENRIYSSRGADEKNWGTIEAVSSKIEVNYEKNSIELKLPSYIFDDKKRYKIYITTWDYDGLENSYRKIENEPKEYIFGGGDKESVLVMDESDVIEVK